jgi:uncharacterized membrane protein YukC
MNYSPFILITILKLKFTSYEIYSLKYNKNNIIITKKYSNYTKDNYNKRILYLPDV